MEKGIILSGPQFIHQHFNKRSTFIRKPGGRLRIAGLIGSVLALFLIFSPSFVCADRITLAWDSNVEPDVAGYIVYYGTQSGYYDFDVDVGDYDSITISGLVEDVMYYFAVSAYDTEGNESDFSAEITYPNSVSPPSSSGGTGGGGSGGCFISTASEKTASASRNYNIEKFALITLAISLLLTALLSRCVPLLRSRQQ
jgi:hypothetical protein